MEDFSKFPFCFSVDLNMLGFWLCCSMIEPGLCLHRTETLNTGWTPFTKTGSVSLYSDIDVLLQRGKVHSHLWFSLMLDCVVKMFLLFSQTCFPTFNCGVLLNALFDCLFINYFTAQRNLLSLDWNSSICFSYALTVGIHYLLRSCNPAVCGVVCVIFLEWGHSNRHMVFLFFNFNLAVGSRLPHPSL